MADEEDPPATCITCDEPFPADNDGDECAECASECGPCGGSGGGDVEMRCPYCGGTGSRRRVRREEDW